MMRSVAVIGAVFLTVGSIICIYGLGQLFGVFAGPFIGGSAAVVMAGAMSFGGFAMIAFSLLLISGRAMRGGRAHAGKRTDWHGSGRRIRHGVPASVRISRSHARMRQSTRRSRRRH
jgi:hypothetical protein